MKQISADPHGNVFSGEKLNLKEQFVSKYDQGGPIPSSSRQENHTNEVAEKRRKAFKKNSATPNQLQKLLSQRQKINNSALLIHDTSKSIE